VLDVRTRRGVLTGLLTSALLLVASSGFADTLQGRVVGLADGDTVTVLDNRVEQHRVRLAGIDAPEKGQPFGSC
jgi:endonuclease YncB( thermonuclease family)